MRETSLACLLDLGLKSQRRATRSHSVPGLFSSSSDTMASSAALSTRNHNQLQTETRNALRHVPLEHTTADLHNASRIVISYWLRIFTSYKFHYIVDMNDYAKIIRF